MQNSSHYQESAQSNRNPSEKADSQWLPILLPGKLRPPQSSSKLIERPQLLQLFQQNKGASLIVVHSPAGFGKTTLLRNAYQSCAEGKGCWLTLDDADNDLGRFLFHLLATLTTVEESAQPASNVGSFHSSINSIGETTAKVFEKVLELAPEQVLFLDDFETIHNEKVLGTVENLIQALPPGAKLVIGCREKPKLSVGRLRAHGRLLEIGPEHLRFSREETDHFLSNQGVSDLDDSLLAHLYETTEGWVTSLQFVAMSLVIGRDASSYIQSFSGTNTALVDYLAEDLLARQPEIVRTFLMQTSILESFNASLCTAICKQQDSDKMLRQMEQNNLFLFVLDDQKEWFRYHNLFKDFLRSQLNTYYPDERIAELHLAAAYWYAEHNRPASAVQHALNSGNTHLAAEIIAKVVEPFFYAGRLTTLTEWIDLLPESELNQHPKILVYYAWCLVWLNRDQEQVDKLIQRLSDPAVFNKADEDVRDEVLMLGPINTVLQDQFEESLKLCNKHLKEHPTARPFVRGVLKNISAYVLTHIGNLSDAEQAAAAAREAHNQSASVYGQVYADSFSGLTELLQGRLQSALAILRGALTLANESGHARCVPAAAAAAYLIAAQYDANQIEEVQRLLNEYGTMITQLGIPGQVISTQLVRARIALQTEGYSQACQVLNELRQHGQQIKHSRMVASAWCEQARMAIQHGDINAASRYLSLSEGSEQLRRYGTELLFPTSIRLLLAQERFTEALSQLNKELRDAEHEGKLRYVLELRILLSEALNLTREHRKSQKELLKAISFAQRENLLRPFIDAGENTMVAVKECRAVSGDAVPASFLKALTPAKAEEATQSAVVDAGNETLTKREFDVLQLLALGYSNQAISDKLFVSLPTVKTHLRNINSKLGAKNRTEAVMIARQQNLVD
ncbi:MAG: LuxR C-terminal-related transcriptional regulator [Amphritea sp.]